MRIDTLFRVLKVSVFFLAGVFMIACRENNPDNPTPETDSNTDVNEPITHVYSDNSDSEAIVKEILSDGTVILEAKTGKIPKKGDILVSGITKAAPRGFLYRAEEIQQSEGQIFIKTSEASLYEVLPNAHINQPLSFQEAGSESPQTMSTFNESTRSKDFNFDFGLNFKLMKKSDNLIKIKEWEYEEKLEVQGFIGLNLGGSFIYDAVDGTPERCGVILKGDVSAELEIEFGQSVKWEHQFGETPLNPICIFVGTVPVVIVPSIRYYLAFYPQEASAESKVYAKWKPINITKSAFESHLIWSQQENQFGNHWDYDASFGFDSSEWSWKDFFKGMANAEVGLSGEIKFSVKPVIFFKLYNSELVSFSIGVSPYAKLSGDIGFKWQADSWTMDDIEFKDELALSAGVEIPLGGNIFGFKTDDDWKISLFEIPLLERGTLFPTFSDFIVYPENDVIKLDYLHASANKGGTLFYLFSDYEVDYGFCYAKIEEGKPREWIYHGVSSNYPGAGHLFLDSYKIEADIPTNNLEPNSTYEIRPYSKFAFPLTSTYFKRPGGIFKTGTQKDEDGDNDESPWEEMR